MAQNWFKHDYNARNDEKILELRAEYGWKGYGLFFGIIEFMCETETGCLDTERIGGLSVAYNLPKDELLAFISFCIDIDLFFEDEDGLIKSGRVVTHLEKMNTYKQAGKKGAKKRWNKQSGRGANGKANNTPNADKIREDKRREDNNYYSQRIVDTVPDIESIEDKNVILACHLWHDVNSLQPNNKTTQRAKVKTWSEPIRLMVEQDDRTYEEIWDLWKRVQKDEFWRTNILSPAKLRDKFDQLSIKLKPQKPQIDEQFIDSLF